MGPMSEVVGNGTQYLSDTDLGAMAAYLQSLPAPPEPAPAKNAASGALNEHGARALQGPLRRLSRRARTRACRAPIRRWPAAGR